MRKFVLFNLYKAEFKGYNLKKFANDSLAGLTVTAVALPLALAFGVASGASAAGAAHDGARRPAGAHRPSEHILERRPGDRGGGGARVRVRGGERVT